MIEDMQHLEVLNAFGREVQTVINEHNARMNGQTDKAQLIAIRLEQNAALTELLRQQRRALQHMAGMKVEPETQFGEAVVVGNFGGATG